MEWVSTRQIWDWRPVSPVDRVTFRLDYPDDTTQVVQGIMKAVRYALGDGIVNAAGKMAGWGAGINPALQDAQLMNSSDAIRITQRTFVSWFILLCLVGLSGAELGSDFVRLFQLLYNIMSATTLYVSGGQSKTTGTYSYMAYRLVPKCVLCDFISSIHIS